MSQEAQNLLVPFRRDKKRDFASGSGPDLLRAKVLQALLTEGAGPRSSGELPWRTSFGAGLHLLRHQRNDDALRAIDTYCDLIAASVLDGLQAEMSAAGIDVGALEKAPDEALPAAAEAPAAEAPAAE